MDLLFRQPHERDAGRCAELLALSQPFPADIARDMPALLAKLLREEAIQSVVYEERTPNPPSTVGFVAVGFADREWLDIELASPASGLVQRLYRAEIEGRPLLLRPKQISAENEGTGLDLVFLHYATRLAEGGDEVASTVRRLNSQTFVFALAGYFCRRVVHEAWEPESIQGLSALGFHAPDGETDVDSSPLLVLEAADVTAVPFHPFTFLFSKQPGRLGFTPAQQRQLRLALWHLTDEDIAAEMEISVNTVRKRWDEIFRRAAEVDSKLFGRKKERMARTRGPDRRHLLLSYLSQHLEELGPTVSRSPN